jgi:ABC-type sugar transport system ATPase subunit
MSTGSINDVFKTYGTQEVIHGVCVDIEHGSFVVLVGPSGCGKSTLLRTIAGLEDFSGGEIRIDDRVVNEVAPRDRDIAMVFQNYALYPHMSVAENMGFALSLARRPKAEITENVEQAAPILDLIPCLSRKPGALSGGQRQRVAMGRAIVRDPKVFLFDEPPSNLDAKLRVQMRSDIKEIQKRLGTTTIYVTHDQTEAMTMADKIVVMRDGIVEQIGSPLELFHKPANKFVVRFIGSPHMNLIEGPFARAADAATVGIRPEHLEVGQTGPGWAGKVVMAEHLGSDTFIYVDVRDAGRITARTNGNQIFETGQAVVLRIA